MPRASRVRGYWLGYMSYALGDAPAAIAHCERALRRPSRRATTRSRCRSGHARQAQAAAGQYAARWHCSSGRSTSSAVTGAAGAPNVGLAYSLVCRGYVVGDRGQFAAAANVRRGAGLRGRPHARDRRSDRRVAQRRADLARALGRHARGGHESARIAEATRSLFQFSIARAIDGLRAMEAQRGPDSCKARRGQRLARAARQRPVPFAQPRLARRRADRRGTSDARAGTPRWLCGAPRRDLIGVAMTWRALARDGAATRGPTRRALPGLRPAGPRARVGARSRGDAALPRPRSRWRRRGRARRALLDAGDAAFDAMAMRWHLGQALQLRERL